MAALALQGSTMLARKAALERAKSALMGFPPLLERSFNRCESLQGELKDRKASEFRVMQWNVLADGEWSHDNPMTNHPLHIHVRYRSSPK